MGCAARGCGSVVPSRESWNVFWVGRDLNVYLVPTPCHELGTSSVPGCSNLASDTSKDGAAVSPGVEFLLDPCSLSLLILSLSLFQRGVHVHALRAQPAQRGGSRGHRRVGISGIAGRDEVTWERLEHRNWDY